MSKKVIIGALSAMVAIGIATQASANTSTTNGDQSAMQKKTKKMLMKKMPSGFEKCYGIAKAGMNDCASGSEGCAGHSTADNQKNAWIGVPTGSCNKIVGGSTTEGSA